MNTPETLSDMGHTLTVCEWECDAVYIARREARLAYEDAQECGFGRDTAWRTYIATFGETLCDNL